MIYLDVLWDWGLGFGFHAGQTHECCEVFNWIIVECWIEGRGY